MTKKHYENLGRIADNFQMLELVIASSIWRIVSQDEEVGQMITSLLPFGKLCILANSLYEHKFGSTPYAVRVSTLIHRCLTLEEKRNQLFHSTWVSFGTSPKVMKMKITSKLQKRLSVKIDEVPWKDIAAIADDMQAVYNEFMRLWDEMKLAGLLTE